MYIYIRIKQLSTNIRVDVYKRERERGREEGESERTSERED